MKRYLITILNPITGSNALLVRSEEDVDKCIMKELKGWDNLSICSTSHGVTDKNYQMSGHTINGDIRYFSILHYTQPIVNTNAITNGNSDPIDWKH